MDTSAYQRAYCDGFVAGTVMPRPSGLVDRQLDEVLRVAGLSPRDRVLEVGCGLGRFTFRLAARGYRIEGMDFSPAMLERFRSYEPTPGAIPLHVGDVLSPPADLRAAYDAVLGFFVLHHLSDLTATFRSVSGLLKPGGRAVFLDVNGLNPLFYLQIATTRGMTWRGDRGMVRMRRGVLADAMGRAGFERMRLTRFGFLPSIVVDRPWGARLESRLHRLGLPGICRAFQIVSAQNPMRCA